MSDSRIDKIQKKQDELSHKLNAKISGDLKNIQEKIDHSIKQNRESLRSFYIDKIEDEQNQAENDMNSGNTVGAMTHKMQADIYSFMLRSL